MSRNSITPSRAVLTSGLLVMTSRGAPSLLGGRSLTPMAHEAIGLGMPCHLDEAHAAVAGDRQALVVAEARDLGAGLLARLHQRGAVLDLDRLAVDDDWLGHRAPLDQRFIALQSRAAASPPMNTAQRHQPLTCGDSGTPANALRQPHAGAVAEHDTDQRADPAPQQVEPSAPSRSAPKMAGERQGSNDQREQFHGSILRGFAFYSAASFTAA